MCLANCLAVFYTGGGIADKLHGLARKLASVSWNGKNKFLNSLNMLDFYAEENNCH